MRDGTVGLGRILGIEVRLHPSWFIIFALVVIQLGVVPGAEDVLSGPAQWVLAIAVGLLFFGSVVVHELAHALVARRFGLGVDRITLFIFGGAANLEQESPTARIEALVAVAGPAANLVLAALFGLPWLVLRDAPDPAGQLAGAVGFYLAASNLLLGLFNLVPGFPMDGGRLLRAAVWAVNRDFVRATRVAALVGRGFAWLLIGVGFLIAIQADVVVGVWLAFIGWFLNQAAETGSKRVEVERAAEGVAVGDVMDRSWPTVPAGLTLDTFVDQVALAQGPGFYVVTQGDELVGTLDVSQVHRVPRGQWAERRIGDVMSRGDQIVTVLAGDSLWNALLRFEESGHAGIAVVDPLSPRRLVGVLTRDGVFRALRARSALLGGPPAGATGSAA
ncbi:MAG TPA: site-2 protease family protein [Candidatus Limnocylindrales bacterium]|nr:site-2 protease family protein [Candidatus Limnocylindrales bacterium]